MGTATKTIVDIMSDPTNLIGGDIIGDVAPDCGGPPNLP